MKVTKELLKQWKDVDIRDVEAKDLVQIKDIKINPKDTPRKKLSDLVNQMENLYFHADKDSVVKNTFGKDKSKTLEDCIIKSYIKGV